MQTPYIRAGHGFNVDHDFARAAVDTPIQVEETRGRFIIGTIAGDMASPLGFMRRPKVRVYVDKAGVIAA